MDDINSHFVSKFGYTVTQVNYLLKLQINKNIFEFSSDNILISVAEPKPRKPRKSKQKKSE